MSTTKTEKKFRKSSTERAKGGKKKLMNPKKKESDQVEELFVKEKSILQNALVNSPEDGKTIM